MSEDRGPQFDAQPSPADEEDRDGELLAMFDRWERDIQTKRGTWLEDAREWFAMEAGDQWKPEDIELLTDRGRIPVVFNMMAPTIDAVCGAEIQNRQQAQFFPRERGDTGVADALTQGVEYLEDQCNGDMEDSEAFRDVLICGEGWTLTQPEVDGVDVTIPKTRVDPLEMAADPKSRKACYEDARYLRREWRMGQDEFDDFKKAFRRPDATGDGGGLGPGKRATIVDPKQRYKNGTLGTGDSDEIVVCEWQWWEREPIHITAMPDPDSDETVKLPLTAEQHSQAQSLVKAAGMAPLESVEATRKVFYRAFVGGGEVLNDEPLKEGAFRYRCITGKRNRNKGTWFGLVKAMQDPQRFLNKLYSEILHIIRTNAKGGMAIEEGAVKDVRQFEESWAQADAITWLKDGALSGANGSRMTPKVAPPIPVAMFQLMEFARDMVRACTGVNEEILGLAGREQPGVLEAQRKQAAYGILGPYFDAKRRYTRDWGKLFLAQMRAYLPKSKLLRVVDQGTQQYVPLAYTLEAEEYDVFVDEAPNTPNQKAKVAATLVPLMENLIAGEILGPEDVAVTLEYLDLPAALVQQLQDSIKKRVEASQPDPAAAQFQQEMAGAELDNKHADTAKKEADAFKTVTEAHFQHADAAVRLLEPAEPPNQAPEPA